MRPANPATLMVRMRESTVALLLQLRMSPDEPLDRVVERLVSRPKAAPAAQPDSASKLPAPRTSVSAAEHHGARVLGELLTAPTLGRLFAAAVDVVNAHDPAGVERLAAMRARKRRYISRLQTEVHPGRPDLGVLPTASGWWVSANVGQVDVQRALRALCDAATLTFGKDIIFPLPTSQNSGLGV